MTLHPPLEVSSREANGIHYVDVHGRLTIGDPSEQLSSFMQQLVSKGARKVIVNLNEIPQIDSSGISALVKLYKDNAATLTPDPLHSMFYDSHPPATLRIARLRGS